MKSAMTSPCGRKSINSAATLLLAISLIFLLSACGKLSDTAYSASTTLATTTSSTVSTKDAAILSDYRTFWKAFTAAADPMNPSDAELNGRATGKELAQIHSSFLAYKAAGQALRGTYDLSPVVANLDGSQATVRDCYFDL